MSRHRLFKLLSVTSLGIGGVTLGVLVERHRSLRCKHNENENVNYLLKNFSRSESTKELKFNESSGVYGDYVFPLVDSKSESRPSLSTFLNLPEVHAAKGAFDDNSLPVPTEPSITSNRVSEIMKFGFPSLDNIRTFENFVLSYDRRNRNAHWVFEHLTHHHVVGNNDNGVDRNKSDFRPDGFIHKYFRATNDDFYRSGYDRGHLAAAANHRHSQHAMDQTFTLSNISPQVGVGFNRHAWNDLEKFVRAIARKQRGVFVVTGPLYLPRNEDGRLYVKYEVIGPRQVAVPTHFFKVLVIENYQGKFELMSFVLPNQALPEKVNLKQYLVPLEAIERAAGFLLFQKIPKDQFVYINGLPAK